MSWVGTAQSKREGQPLPWYWQLIAALLLVAAVICLVDVLAIAVRGAVESRDQSWPWGSREQSSGQPAATPTTFRMASVHLVVSVNGDQLVARYTVKSSSQEALTSQVLSTESAGSSTTMVNDLLGQISIAQFRDGITGNQLAWGTLSFGPPQLQVTGDNTTVTISSNPFRLLLAQQYIEVYQPAEQTDALSRDVEFVDPSEVQVLHITGARLTSAANGDTELQPGNSAVEAVLREPGANWTTGLRSIGGVNLPGVNGPLQRLASLVVYVVLLWSLSRVRRYLPPLRRDVQSVVVVSRNAVGAIVAALIALSVLELAYQVMFWIQPRSQVGPWLAGPTGLMVAGAVVLWPAACFRVKPAEKRPSARRRWLGPLATMLIASAAYLTTLAVWLGVHQLTRWQILLATPGLVVLVYLLGTLVLRRSDRLSVPYWVLAPLLAVVLASTVIWPVLVYDGFYKGTAHNAQLYVNLIGKWTYFTAALISLVSLCVMAVVVIGILSASHLKQLRSRLSIDQRAGGVPRTTEKTLRTWRWIWRAGAAAVIVVTLLATVPWLINQSGIRNRHATGLVPPSLAFYSGLYRALPQLLNWLFLGLAIAILLSASRALRPVKDRRIAQGWTETQRIAASRLAMRQLAIPVMMLILFSPYSYYYAPWVMSNNTWLYLPITPILGLMILAWVVLPAKLARADRTLATKKAIRLTLQAWRNAEFTDSQRQKIVGDGDDLRGALLKDGTSLSDDQTFRLLSRAQDQLGEQHDAWQRKGHARLGEAFDHQGELPDPRRGLWGALAGAVLGLVPGGILLLATHPASAWSGYPVLDFLGFTAWILFMWSAFGWAFGYFLPYIRGRNGINKALWLYTVVGASLPMNLLWLDGHDWKISAIYYLELFAFLVIIGVILGDLMALKSAGMSPRAWIQVYNRRFIITWSTTVIAAIGTAAAAFLSTAATDLGQQTITVVTGQTTSAPSAVPGTSSHG